MAVPFVVVVVVEVPWATTVELVIDELEVGALVVVVVDELVGQKP